LAGSVTAREAWGGSLAAGAAVLGVLAVALAGSLADAAWTWTVAFGALAVFVLLLRRSRSPAAAPPEDAASENAALEPKGLAAALPDPVIVFDANGFVVTTNPAAQAAFGALPPGLSLPLRFRAPEVQALVEEAVAGNRAVSGEYAERVPLERVFRVTAAPAGGRFWALSFQDWSEARRTDRMRADFVANASHELRTPLASIAGFVETLRGPAKNDAAAREKFLGIIGEQTARMSRLIDDLLSLSRLETRPFLDLSTPVDLVGVARDVADSLKPLADESGVRVELALVPEDGRFAVGGSRDELFQVLENLVENACNYGSSGGRVEIRLEREASGVALAVRDWGPGIAAEHLPRITERFYRADTASSRTKRGTGLGLAIVKHIATRHHARMAIRSEPGQGASFRLHFPLP
jgi:two-component system, OmpR family, phosphate regulon sensor histidine kinase PhoR